MSNEGMTFEDMIVLVENEMDKTLSAAPFIIRGYIKHLTKSRGKFIRAVSLLTCAEDERGFIQDNAVKMAAAIEILHLATLVHDDVIDNAHKRRGMVTLQKKYGKRAAVICGDYLLCVALKLVSTATDKENYLDLKVPDYMSRICIGELNQHVNNGNLDLSVYKYLKIIAGKTAALFEASFYAGAILCKDDTADTKKYMRLGRYIGMIFQLSDDCIDFEMSENIAKKPVQSDYEQGVITLPLIYALKNMKSFKENAAAKEVSRSDINNAVLKTGGLIFARKVSEKYYNKACIILNQLGITENKRKKLRLILDKAYHGL